MSDDEGDLDQGTNKNILDLEQAILYGFYRIPIRREAYKQMYRTVGLGKPGNIVKDLEVHVILVFGRELLSTFKRDFGSQKLKA